MVQRIIFQFLIKNLFAYLSVHLFYFRKENPEEMYRQVSSVTDRIILYV